MKKTKVDMIAGRVCVPDNDGFKKLILDEAHNTCHFVHLRGSKMKKDSKK